MKNRAGKSHVAKGQRNGTVFEKQRGHAIVSTTIEWPEIR
jgi:hypothetical protein